MLRNIVIASTALLLLAACQEQQAVRPAPPTPAPERNFTLLFDTGSATLSVEAQAAVGRAAGTYKSVGCCAIAVSGHTDTVGTAGYNLDLSKRRAAAAQAELERNGVPRQAIVALGYGESDLPVPTAQNVANQRNRSVDVVVSDRRPEVLMSDTAYCKSLSATYRRYRPNQIDEAVAGAMSQCESANAAAAIPTLEQHLNDQKIPLPPRMTRS
jgi:hypothetical protein